ncbi:hypothetical protein LZ30DRAFT_148463 [Colletotrichum cereale]|nr:hypothetical protein LZ30DRAFT_148463 [Colletotrichum cereale]
MQRSTTQSTVWSLPARALGHPHTLCGRESPEAGWADMSPWLSCENSVVFPYRVANKLEGGRRNTQRRPVSLPCIAPPPSNSLRAGLDGGSARDRLHVWLSSKEDARVSKQNQTRITVLCPSFFPSSAQSLSEPGAYPTRMAGCGRKHQNRRRQAADTVPVLSKSGTHPKSASHVDRVRYTVSGPMDQVSSE